MSLAYWGSKKKLATRIADVLCEEHPGDKFEYYEPFCGMAHVGIELLKRKCTSSSHWSDANVDVIKYWLAVKRGWLPPTKAVTDAEWTRMKGHGSARHSRSRKRSKGSRRSSSASPTHRTSRPLSHIFYGFQLGWGGHMLNGRTPGDYLNNEPHLKRVRERVKETAPLLSSVDIKHALFQDVRPSKGSVIYCDPPYIRSDGKAQGRHFLHSDMDLMWACLGRWIRDRKCDVYLSASEKPKLPPGLRAVVVRTWSVMNRTTTINSGDNNRKEHLLRIQAV